MKKVLILFLALCSFAVLTACNPSLRSNGTSSGSSGTISSGNWGFVTSAGLNSSIALGGQLNASGNAVTGNLFVVGGQSSGFLLSSSTAPMAVTGSLNNGTLTLSGVVASSTITMTFTVDTSAGAVTTLAGTYTVVGGTDDGDSGNVTGQLAGDFSGTWAGTDANTNGTISIALTEGALQNNFFPVTLTGTGITFANGAGGCNITATLDATKNSFVAGGIVFLNISTIDGGLPGQLTYLGVDTSPSIPDSLVGSYTYTGGSTCMLDNSGTAQALTLTKQ